MLELVINNLVQSGWEIHSLERNWVCATHESLRRGLFLGDYSELPDDFQPWIQRFADFPKFDVLVICPQGIDSSLLKQHRFPNLQLWYWDTPYGNLFPFPPSEDPIVPRWIRQLASGKPLYLEQVIHAEKRFMPFFTYAFLVVNLIVFGLMTLAGGSTEQRVLIAFGAKVNTLIQEGEVWRLITSMFIHIGVMHLFFNLYALRALGSLAEEIFGHRNYFLIYLCAGLGGSVASFIFSPALSAGASGAIFGLLGALLYYSYKRPNLWKSGLGVNLVIVILVNIAFGFIVPGIDNFAHLGGLLMGTMISILLTRSI
ncbi:rhomboid family intramembrane serine protease [Desulfosporosinus burensis]